MSIYILIACCVFFVMQALIVAMVIDQYFELKKQKTMIEDQNYIFETIIKHYDHFQDEYDKMRSTNNQLINHYTTIVKQHETIIACIKELSMQHDKLLQCWKDVGEEYACAYEAFKEYNDRLKKIEEKMSEKITVKKGKGESKVYDSATNEIKKQEVLKLDSVNAGPYNPELNYIVKEQKRI